MAGTLLITETSVASARDEAVPGTEIPYTSDSTLNSGALVEGTIAPDGSGGFVFNVTAVLDPNPTIVSSPVSGNVTIGANRSYLVTNTGSINGNVNVNGGVLTVIGGSANGNISIGANAAIICNSGATVSGGTFRITGSGSNTSVIIHNSTVNGRFSTQGIYFVSLLGNTHNGHIESGSDTYVTVRNNTTNNNSNLAVTAVANDCYIENNRVSGTVTLDPQCQA